MAKTNTTKTKTAPEATASTAPPAAAQAPAATAGPEMQGPVEQRENPRINEKIDEWIKRFPDKWSYFLALPPERMARKLVLHEIDKYERQEKAKSYRQQDQQQGERGPRQEYRQGNGQGRRY
jgi:hypothetical protein